MSRIHNNGTYYRIVLYRTILRPYRTEPYRAVPHGPVPLPTESRIGEVCLAAAAAATAAGGRRRLLTRVQDLLGHHTRHHSVSHPGSTGQFNAVKC